MGYLDLEIEARESVGTKRGPSRVAIGGSMSWPCLQGTPSGPSQRAFVGWLRYRLQFARRKPAIQRGRTRSWLFRPDGDVDRRLVAELSLISSPFCRSRPDSGLCLAFCRLPGSPCWPFRVPYPRPYRGARAAGSSEL